MIKDGATRDGYGSALVELGNSDPNVVVLDSGVGASSHTPSTKTVPGPHPANATGIITIPTRKIPRHAGRIIIFPSHYLFFYLSC